MTIQEERDLIATQVPYIATQPNDVQVELARGYAPEERSARSEELYHLAARCNAALAALRGAPGVATREGKTMTRCHLILYAAVRAVALAKGQTERDEWIDSETVAFEPDAARRAANKRDSRLYDEERPYYPVSRIARVEITEVEEVKP